MYVVTTQRLDTSRHITGLIDLTDEERHTHQGAAEEVLAQRCRQRGLVLGAVSHDWRLAGVHARRDGDERPPTGVWVLRSSAWCGYRERAVS